MSSPPPPPPPPPPTAGGEGSGERGSLEHVLNGSLDAFWAAGDVCDDDEDAAAMKAVAEELRACQAAVKGDLRLVAAAKHACITAVDLAFAATKDVPSQERTCVHPHLQHPLPCALPFGASNASSSFFPTIHVHSRRGS
jgi:hypothetical protein